jgi:hypothetical protein
MSVEEYIEAQRHNIQEVARLPHFAQLIRQVDEIYNHTISIFPSDVPARYIRFLLLFHKSFLSAATLIGQCQPDDAAAITRRGIEVARICLASKHDEANHENWLSYEKLYQRWQSGERNEKPPSLPYIQLKLPDNHPILDDLMRQFGFYSDAFADFTPDYFASLDWKDNRNVEPPRIALSYFTSDQRILERELLTLAEVHAKFMRIIDECIDGFLHKNADWRTLMSWLNKTGVIVGKLFEDDAEKTKSHLVHRTLVK